MHYHLSFDVFGNDYVGFSSKKNTISKFFFGIKVQISASLEHFVEHKPLIYEELDGNHVPLYIKLRREQ